MGMGLALVVAVLTVAAALPAAAGATGQAAAAAATEPAASAAAPQEPDQAAPRVDPTKLGVSMSRIRRELRISESREQPTGSPLRLQYQVQVYGTAPRIDIIKEFDISRNAPLSYGAPTHQDFINQWTPQAYKSPRWPIGSLAGWALFTLVQRADKAKCEAEIAEYRALVMQGVSAPAPRCTQ